MTLPQANLADIDDLLARVRQAAGGAVNQARGKKKPGRFFNVEDPIVWATLYDFDANRYYSDARFYFAQNLLQKLWRWETFPDEDSPLNLDVPAWLGHYVEFTFIGLSVGFTPRGVPIIQTDHPLTRTPDLSLLRPVEFKTSGWIDRMLRWHEQLSVLAAGRVHVPFAMVWWRGCLDLAVALRGYENLVADMVERPQFVHGLLKWLVEQRCRWYEGYYRHFGLKPSIAYVADDWINVPFITPAMFADFVLPRYLEIEKFHGAIGGVHSCGNQAPVQKYLLEIKSLPGLEVSPWTDLETTLANVPPAKNLVVALHPNDVLIAGRREMENKLTFIRDRCLGRNYTVATSGLTPLSDDHRRYEDSIRMWIEVGNQVLG